MAGCRSVTNGSLRMSRGQISRRVPVMGVLLLSARASALAESDPVLRDAVLRDPDVRETGTARLFASRFIEARAPDAYSVDSASTDFRTSLKKGPR